MTDVAVNLVAVPLGVPRRLETNGNVLIPVTLVWSIRFAGVADSNLIKETALRLPAIAYAEVPCKIAYYKNGASGTINANLKQVTSNENENIARRFAQYLTGSSELKIEHARAAKILPHDDRFDNLSPTDIVDTQAFYEKTLSKRDYYHSLAHELITETITSTEASIYQVDGKFSKAINALVMRSIVDEYFPNLDKNKPSTDYFDDFLKDLAREKAAKEKQDPTVIEKEWDDSKALDSDTFMKLNRGFKDRIYGYQDPAKTAGPFSKTINEKTITEEELQELLANRDPNILLAAAEKDPTLSMALGLSSKWELELDATADGADSYEIICSLPDSTLGNSGSLKINTKPTVFRATDEVSPLPFHPELENTGVLACLNGRNEGADYRATSVNAHNEIHKSWIIQSSNSINTVTDEAIAVSGLESAISTKELENKIIADSIDAKKIMEIANSPAEEPELLRLSNFGINEPETDGITFSASPLDLVANDSAYNAEARQSQEKYFLEDLWIGYRIDVAPENQNTFLSLNTQMVGITADYFKTEAGDEDKIQSFCENYFEREQLSSDRPIGTEFYTWTGISPAQCFPFKSKKDGTRKSAEGESIRATASDLFNKEVCPTTAAYPNLQFGRKYNYYLRNVFCGGISIDAQEVAQLLGENPSRRSRQTQSFSFNRVRTLSPGEIVNPNGVGDTGLDTNDTEQTIYLLENDSHKTIFVTPRPLDLNEIRFHGLIGKNSSEAARYRDYALTKNVRKLLFDQRRLHWKHYFLDPDVTGINVRSQSKTRNIVEPPGIEMFDGVICDLISDWSFSQIEVPYSNSNNWEDFRPIEFSFRRSSRSLPAAAATRSFFGSGPQVKYHIPYGECIEIVVRPTFDFNLASRSVTAKNSLLAERELANSKIANVLQLNMKDNTFPLFPFISERVIRVIDAPRKPLTDPVFEFTNNYARSSVGEPENEKTLELRKLEGKNTAYIAGLVRVHAPTTGKLYFEVEWNDINDRIVNTDYNLEKKFLKTESRSVIFKDRPIPGFDELDSILNKNGVPAGQRADNLRDMFGKNCVENSVHYRFPDAEDSIDSQNGDDRHPISLGNEVPFEDGRRRVGRFRVHALGRFQALYSDGEFERYSSHIAFDTRNSTLPPDQKISHVLPTFKYSHAELSEDRDKVSQEMGLRIYVHRPCFVTGPGERIGLGFGHVSENSPEAYAQIKHYCTMWGEDPLSRPNTSESKRIPRATDFVSPVAEGAEILDVSLYPGHRTYEREMVLLQDNVKLPEDPNSDASSTPVISVSGFALIYDPGSTLWYVDVAMNSQFTGWLKLAIYRFQPHSVEGFHLSMNPTHAYAAVLHGYGITRHVDGSWLTVMIGPVFDKTVSFQGTFAQEVADGIWISDPDNVPSDEMIKSNSVLAHGQRYFKITTLNSYAESLIIQSRRGGEHQYSFSVGDLRDVE